MLSAAPWTGIYNPRADISLHQIKDAFTEAFSTVRALTHASTGVNITFVMILYPDFYNTAIQDAIFYAALETNIAGWMPGMQLTHRQLFEWNGNLLLFNGNRSSGVSGRANLLLLNQGFRTFGVLTSGEHCLMNILAKREQLMFELVSSSRVVSSEQLEELLDMLCNTITRFLNAPNSALD
ncbi:uncharacterized protein BDV14DRAFT_197719 [Aspergillus stella-maris]|uniref:uncharacterized protein n=1 Tax=Aspergillus stella-maris TaxID=1810926 RepID=UPI003CCD68CA